ncbi:MAG: TlpA family protein disulfide reductase [bacterium]
MSKQTIVGVLTIAALAVSGSVLLTRPRGSSPDTADRIPAAAPNSPPAAILRPAPDFLVVLYQGQEVIGGSTIRLSQLWGQGRPVVMNFWAGLCPPCRAEMPDFQKLYNERAQGQFFLVGVDIGSFIGLGSQEEGKALLRELNITFPAGTTLDRHTVGAYQILGMPTTVFITAQGRIFRKYTGLLTRAQMDTFVAELVRTSGTP